MYKFLLLFIFLPLYSLSAQNTWQFTNPKPQGNNLYAVKFVDNNTVFASGDGGIVLKSTNAGLTWTVLNTNIMKTYCGISNYDPSHIALSSYSQYTVLTTNTGLDWISYFNSNISLSYQISDFSLINTRFYTDANTIYSNFREYYCFKSTNGGINFSVWPISYYRPREIYFINSNTGWIYNDSCVYKTTNSGLNFSIQKIQKYSGIRNFCFLNEYFGVLLPIENPMLLTTNGGINWTQRTIDSIEKYFRVELADSNTIYMCRDSGIVIKSTNMGMNWVTLNTGYNESLYSMDFLNSNTGIVVGATSCLLITTNGGLNWNQKRTGIRNDIESFYFFNESTGIFVGDSSFIAKTTNGGSDLSLINIRQSGKFFGINFFDQNTGYIVGEQGRIIKTTNGGNNWRIIYSDSTIWLIDINFINSSTGFAVGSKQTILKTTNGGANWYISYQGVFDQMQFLKVKFTDNNTLFVSGEYLFKSTDCGSNWSMVFPPDPYNLYYFNDLDFYGNTIYTIRYNSSYNYSDFLFSTNNGNNWIVKNIDNYTFPRFIPFGIDFISENTGYICGQGNTIVKTTNKGTNWIVEQGAIFPGYVDNANRNRLKKIIVFDSSNIITAGQRGVIFRKGNPIITSISNKNSNINSSYILSQNYPNPFNPTTNIRYEIPKNGFVKLVVFDILGREIQTLVNEKQNAGKYEVTFNARQPRLGSNLSSGIYFYTLSVSDPTGRIGDYTETKKMVLIK